MESKIAHLIDTDPQQTLATCVEGNGSGSPEACAREFKARSDGARVGIKLKMR